MKLFPNMLFEENKDGAGGGGGTGTKTDPPATPDAAALAAKIAALEAENATLKAGKKPDDPKPDDDLAEKARKQREANERTSNDTKALETALKFTMGANTFLKENAGLLPKEINDIFAAAEKETYGSAKQKADALKAAVVQSFFKVQSNLEMLTPGLKSQLDEYLKLTKDGKEQEASRIFDSIFEPAFERLKAVKKAENLSKGFSSSGSADDEYKQKLMRGSRRHHLGEKQ